MNNKTLYSSKKILEEYITVNNCGEQDLGDRDYNTLRENGRVDFGLQFIAKGKCYFEDDGEIKTAESGSAILHFPSVRQHYFFKKQDNTVLMWSHFSGKACKLLDPVKSNRTVLIRLSDAKEFEKILRTMITVYNRKERYYETVCEGYMTVLLAHLLKSALPDTESENCTVNDGIEKVINYMNINYNKPIDLDKYAKMCYVSHSRFCHIFKEYTGVSPYRFQLRIRIDRAVELLTYTSLSVSECASKVGFNDCSYFCRVFKKFTAKTPSYYRK